jgi:hypothetical protein
LCDPTARPARTAALEGARRRARAGIERGSAWTGPAQAGRRSASPAAPACRSRRRPATSTDALGRAHTRIVLRGEIGDAG